MRSILRPAAAGSTAPQFLVWLPGAFQRLEDFLQAGFDAAVRHRGLSLDLAFVDLEPAHLTDRSVLEALATQVLEPARQRGARRLWVAGISLGGYLALEYAVTRPHGWDGLCLISPFLGSKGLISELEAASAPSTRPLESLAPSAEERRIWDFVRSGGLADRRCFLGFGEQDRYAAAHELFSRLLPAAVVHRVGGGHDWPTWRRLWDHFLEEMP